MTARISAKKDSDIELRTHPEGLLALNLPQASAW